MVNFHNTNKQKLYGFTIIELLVVIVVIGILAAIILISYNGVTKKAKEVFVAVTLSNAKKQLDIFYSINNQFPLRNICPADQNSQDDICLDKNTYYEPSIDRQLYRLDAWYPGTIGWRQVVTAVFGICGVSLDSKAYCLGRTNFTAGYITKTPRLVDEVNGFVNTNVNKFASKNTSAGHVCLIDSNNQLYCWGENWAGQLGSGSISSGYNVADYKPNKVANYNDFINFDIKDATVGGMGFTCAIAGSNNELFCWGNNSRGQLGSGDYLDKLYPNKVIDKNGFINQGVKAVSAGYNHVCTVAADNKIYCWGDAFNQKIGNLPPGVASYYSTTSSNMRTADPIPLYTGYNMDILGSPISYLITGNYDSCFINKDYSFLCYGNTAIIPASQDIKFKNISVGESMSCGISTDEKAYCWSRYNSYGRLGTGNTQLYTTAQQVFSTSNFSNNNVKYISTGSMSSTSNSCVINADFQLNCWGYTEYTISASNCPSDKLFNNIYCSVPILMKSP